MMTVGSELRAALREEWTVGTIGRRPFEKQISNVFIVL